MSLLGPNKGDIQKLHAEINQIVNQRLAITTLAITIFGVMVAFLLPTKDSFNNKVINDSTFFISHLLLIVLFSLFLLTHHLTSMLRIFTTYLSVSNASTWEIDWRTYRSKYKYLGYTKPLAIIFLILGLISILIPFFFWAIYSLEFQSRMGLIMSIILGLAYITLVFGMGFQGWFTKEEDLLGRWEGLNKDEQN